VEDIVGATLNSLGDGVTVNWSQPENAKYQQVQRSLKQLHAFARLFGRHSRCARLCLFT
jgi:hypothetical protein